MLAQDVQEIVAMIDARRWGEAFKHTYFLLDMKIRWHVHRALVNTLERLNLARLVRRLAMARGRLLNDREARLWAANRDGPAIDFVGTVETYWSIAVVNRTVVESIVNAGFRLGIFSRAALRRQKILTKARRVAQRQGRLNVLLLPPSRTSSSLIDCYNLLTHQPLRRNIVFFGYIDAIERRLLGKFNMAWVVYETAPIPRDHLRKLARLDLVLVPTRFVKDLCVESGVDPARVEVFPHCTDVAELNPESAARHHPGDGVFRFLNIGLAHFKQGKELLLEAYLTEFDPDEKVCLMLKESPLVGDGKRIYPHETQPVRALLEKVKARLGRPAYPQVEVFDGEEIGAIVELYGRSDCYVSPLFSNGFALTVLESMACARPAIVTRFGGLLDYCTDDNAFLVDVEAMEVAGERQYHSKVADKNGGRFARPSLADLRKKMRRAARDPRETRAVGARASADVRDRYSPAANAEIFRDIMRRAHARLPDGLPGAGDWA